MAAMAGLAAAPAGWSQSTPHQSRPLSHVSSVTPFATVVPGHRLEFPRDDGSHPDFRLEWWYLTGWLEDEDRKPLGFQITFFRVRPELTPDNPSAFAPRQIIIAHAALSVPARGRLLHRSEERRVGKEGRSRWSQYTLSRRRSNTDQT